MGKGWRPTIHLVAVLVFGTVAIALRADARVVGVIGVMVCAALRWNGPWPTITFGSKTERDPRP